METRCPARTLLLSPCVQDKLYHPKSKNSYLISSNWTVSSESACLSVTNCIIFSQNAFFIGLLVGASVIYANSGPLWDWFLLTESQRRLLWYTQFTLHLGNFFMSSKRDYAGFIGNRRAERYLSLLFESDMFVLVHHGKTRSRSLPVGLCW